jgi:hypothetical protein
MNIEKIWYVKHSKYMLPCCYECDKVINVEAKQITRRISLIPNISFPVAMNAESLPAPRASRSAGESAWGCMLVSHFATTRNT